MITRIARLMNRPPLMLRRTPTVTGTNCWWNTAGEPVRFLDKPLAVVDDALHETEANAA